MKKPEFFKKIKQVYFVGLKGVGMTALACCLQDLGIKVSGSDVEEIFVTDKVLKKRKIKWRIGFDPSHLKPKPDLVITTGAHGGLGNPEVVAAGKMKVPILTHAQALGKMMEDKEGISVCGVGGKTTTASIIAHLLTFAHLKPSYAIGVGEIYPLGWPGKYDEGKQFIAEADEYINSPGIDDRPRFSFQNPKIIVVTNIEYDHPDVYRDIEHTKETFLNFFEKIPKDGLLLATSDNLNNLSVIKKFSGPLQTYGFSPQADWRIEKSYQGEGQTIFDIGHKGMVVKNIILKIPGRYNLLNATGAFASAMFLGLDPKIIKKGLATFAGSKRRFELIGQINNIRLYDDYAHHPHEVVQLLTAAQKWLAGRRIIAIFQPHTYSRTKALFREFARAFSGADIVVISDIYASAREKDNLGMHSRLLAAEAQKFHPHAVYQSGEKEAISYLQEILRPNDAVITIGAGNIFQWHKDILKIIREVST